MNHIKGDEQFLPDVEPDDQTDSSDEEILDIVVRVVIILTIGVCLFAVFGFVDPELFKAVFG